MHHPFSALTDCLVLDLSRLLPGPYCSMILADHGARVIAIEDPRYEKESMPILDLINRNKEHMALNLKTDKGKETFLSLVRKADVVLEGFRPGVMERLGLDYDRIKTVNPRTIYCSLTGYGQDSELKNVAGHDINFLSVSGVLSLIGTETPCIPGIQIGDISGGLYAAIGILMAWIAREKTGMGQYIDISMTDTLMAMLPLPLGWLATYHEAPQRSNFLLSHRYACYHVYETSDGKFMAVGALERRFWANICQYFDVPEYESLQFDEHRREEIIQFFQSEFLKRTRDEWAMGFQDRDACVSPVMELDEAVHSRYARQREIIIEQNPSVHPNALTIGTPIKLSDTPGGIRTPPPSFGKDTAAILKEFGFSETPK